jgi:hypothetical protein
MLYRKEQARVQASSRNLSRAHSHFSCIEALCGTTVEPSIRVAIESGRSSRFGWLPSCRAVWSSGSLAFQPPNAYPVPTSSYMVGIGGTIPNYPCAKRIKYPKSARVKARQPNAKNQQRVHTENRSRQPDDNKRRRARPSIQEPPRITREPHLVGFWTRGSDSARVSITLVS